jgi:hypothetical protein
MKGKIFEYIRPIQFPIFRTLDAWKWNRWRILFIKMKAQDSRYKKYGTKRKIFSLKYNVPRKNHNYWLFCQGCNPVRIISAPQAIS